MVCQSSGALDAANLRSEGDVEPSGGTMERLSFSGWFLGLGPRSRRMLSDANIIPHVELFKSLVFLYISHPIDEECPLLVEQVIPSFEAPLAEISQGLEVWSGWGENWIFSYHISPRPYTCLNPEHVFQNISEHKSVGHFNPVAWSESWLNGIIPTSFFCIELNWYSSYISPSFGS